MSRTLRKSIGLMAIFAIAMHAILFGVPIQSAASAVDPFTVICHSGPVDPAAPAPSPSPASQPTKACDHCSLCFIAGPLDAPDTILAGLLTPASVLHALTAASTAARAHFAASPHLPRGPPQRA